MTKGRNAAKAFQASRAARFAESRKAAAEQRAREVAEGKRREIVVVDVDDVRDDDVFMTEHGESTDRADMVVVNGQTMVKRFRTTD